MAQRVRANSRNSGKISRGLLVSDGSDWITPELDSSNFTQSIGSSFIEQFVIGHDPIDALRELVQNEFDAGGEEMAVEFLKAGLTVSGTGKAIDGKGWNRLSVILGTGTIVGDKSAGLESVTPKEHGIGSKNFGLRSLFLFGDRIHVRSNGSMAVMDLPSLGTTRLPDPMSAGRRGVSIYVPYRTVASGKLSAFDADRERTAIHGMAAELFSTLGKLSLAGKTKGIRRVSLSSVRTGINLVWTQSATVAPCKVKGVSAIRRSGKLVEWRSGSDGDQTKTTFEDIEYSKSISVPASLTPPPYPPYYRAPGKVLRIGVSLPIKRNRIDLRQSGHFHYPLRAPGGNTGTVMSVSAPFEMNVDRSELVANDWNGWLANEAAKLAIELLGGDWIHRFGADAYLALDVSGSPKRAWVADGVLSKLKTAACWATEDEGALSVAADLVVPIHEELRGFLGSRRDLRADLGKVAKVLAMAEASGAKRFTTNSLVRLRCAPKEGTGLQTKVKPEEANFHFNDYRMGLTAPGMQVRFGRALDKVTKNLSHQNRTDLERTASTLAADGSLRSAAELVIVPDDLWKVCPVPDSSRLHQKLRAFRTMSSLCRVFDINGWIADVTQRARSSSADEEELEALYSYLLKCTEGVSRRSISAIRSSPVIKDADGRWASPDNLTMLPVELTKILGDTVARPAVAVVNSRELMEKLSIRRKLSARDLVSLAWRVSEDRATAADCEDLLSRNLRILTPAIVSELRQIPFMRTKAGGLAAPYTLHLNTQANSDILNEGSLIVGSASTSLCKSLKVRSLPSLQALVDRLRRLREENVAPFRAGLIYGAMAAAVLAEKKPLSSLKEEAILWADGAYHTPANMLVGPMVPRSFDLVFPVIRGNQALEQAYLDIGASRQPSERHWADFFERIGKRSLAGWALGKSERTALRLAYARRGSLGLPDTVGKDTPCLLSQGGTLHARQQLADSSLLENDYPELAGAVIASGGNIAFADLSEGGGPFFVRSGLRRLSEVCGAPKVTVGDAVRGPSWYSVGHETGVLKLMHDHDFAIALRELGWAAQRTSSLFNSVSTKEISRRLRKITRVSFFTRISKRYIVSGKTASVEASSALMDDQIALTPPRSSFDYHLAMAPLLAELAGATRLGEIRVLGTAILPLLGARSGADMRSYLLSQGLNPKWPNAEPDDEDGNNDPTVQAENAASAILGQLMSGVSKSEAHLERPPAPAPLPPPQIGTQPAPVVQSLPSIGKVKATIASPSGRMVEPAGAGGGGGYGSLSWAPRTASEIERDRLLGIRGEEIALRAEVERLRSFGHFNADALVIWVSQLDPGADHDIRSVAPDGKPLYIEVKSSVGGDGRFDWSYGEFSKALREGDHYELWRVYHASDLRPTIKKFPNPVALLGQSRLRLELASLRAVVEPIG